MFLSTGWKDHVPARRQPAGGAPLTARGQHVCSVQDSPDQLKAAHSGRQPALSVSPFTCLSCPKRPRDQTWVLHGPGKFTFKLNHHRSTLCEFVTFSNYTSSPNKDNLKSHISAKHIANVIIRPVIYTCLPKVSMLDRCLLLFLISCN